MTDSGWSVDGKPAPLGDDYTDTVTHLRIFDEGDGWALDGADDEGNYTPAVWKYDTFEQAWARVEEFTEFLADEGYNIEPRDGRKKSPTPKATRPGNEDYCYTCERVTRWDGEFCSGCGRQWGYEHPPEPDECQWFVNNATEAAWCCNNHMYDGTGDFPATGEHPEHCPFREEE